MTFFRTYIIKTRRIGELRCTQGKNPVMSLYHVFGLKPETCPIEDREDNRVSSGEGFPINKKILCFPTVDWIPKLI